MDHSTGNFKIRLRQATNGLEIIKDSDDRSNPLPHRPHSIPPRFRHKERHLLCETTPYRPPSNPRPTKTPTTTPTSSHQARSTTNSHERTSPPTTSPYNYHNNNKTLHPTSICLTADQPSPTKRDLEQEPSPNPLSFHPDSPNTNNAYISESASNNEFNGSSPTIDQGTQTPNALNSDLRYTNLIVNRLNLADKEIFLKNQQISEYLSRINQLQNTLHHIKIN